MAALIFLSVGAGCNDKGDGGNESVTYTPVNYTYQKQSDHLVHFSSSDESLDFFLNDYFKRQGKKCVYYHVRCPCGNFVFHFYDYTYN